MSFKDPIVVVGGGAAGILSAVVAGEKGAKVILLEKNKKLGIKILISGGGKCNITHAGEMSEVGGSFQTSEARFLRPSFHAFTNADILRLLQEEGVEVFARENGRVFPQSGRAGDVMGALESLLRKAGVVVECNSPVDAILRDEGTVAGVSVGGRTISSNHVVLATGGISYAKTGTTGDGYAWAKSLGHTVVPLRPALAPMKLSPALPTDWRGVALRDGRLSIYSEDRKVFEWSDDVLFTHEGLSGPAALEVSRAAALSMERSPVELRFDFLPEMDLVDVDRQLLAMISAYPDRFIQTHIERWIPNRMVPPLLRSIGVDPMKRGYNLLREERRSTVALLKSWRMGRVESIDIDRGEVTAGGIALSEVDPKTMRSRKIKGLYICGEILDVAGPVGGYNLQAAFSTGYVGGLSAAADWLSSASADVDKLQENHGSA